MHLPVEAKPGEVRLSTSEVCIWRWSDAGGLEILTPAGMRFFRAGSEADGGSLADEQTWNIAKAQGSFSSGFRRLPFRDRLGRPEPITGDSERPEVAPEAGRQASGASSAGVVGAAQGEAEPSHVESKEAHERVATCQSPARRRRPPRIFSTQDWKDVGKRCATTMPLGNAAGIAS
jgi:hypothetical protein